MKLYLLRHGEAASTASADGERSLTTAGVEQTGQVVARFPEQLAAIQAIYTSPKLRALQTATIASAMGPGLEPAIIELISPESSINPLGAFLDQQGDDAVMLVTHQPFVGNLIDFLTDQPGTGYGMGTSCLACLDLIAFGRGCATLEWLESP